MDGIQNERLIDKYSRAQAIEDGQLVDVTGWAKRVGIKFPVAFSREVWFKIIEPDDAAKDAGESQMGRLGKFLLKLRSEMLGSGGDRLEFQYTVNVEGEPKLFSLYATLLPGDDLEPVITVLTQGED
jgi:hypothetical protein